MEFLSLSQILLACLASLAAGFVDSIVGGGGLIQLPALLLLFPHLEFGAVSAINKSSMICGTAFALFRYSRALSFENTKRRLGLGCTIAFGAACIGAFLSAHAPTNSMKKFAFFALLAVAAFTFFRPNLGGRIFWPRVAASAKLVALAAAVGFYDGFFGPGTGSFFVFGLVTLLGLDFLHAAGEAKALNLATNLAAILTLAAAGFHDFQTAGLLAVFNMTGSYFGTQLALQKGTQFVRKVFMIVVLTMIIKLAFDVFLEKTHQEPKAAAQTIETPVSFTIVHTNDLHSAFLGSGPDRLYTPQPDGDPVTGGYARIATAVTEIRERKTHGGEPVLLMDSGDFYGGSLFHMLAVSPETPLSPELQFFHDLSYDAVTLGNHEFDAGEEGLGLMFQKAAALGIQIPLVVSSMTKTIEPAPRLQAVHSVPVLVKRIPAQSQTPHEAQAKTDTHNNPGSLAICIFGAMGPDALFSSAPHRKTMTFAGYSAADDDRDLSGLAQVLRSVMAEAKERENCGFNILLFHEGTPEDVELAQKVPQLDVILSGHTHETTLKKQGKTWISQTGSGGSHLGMLEFSLSSAGVTLRTPKDEVHLKITDGLTSDPKHEHAIERAKLEVDRIRSSHQPKFDAPIRAVNEDLPLNLDYPNNPLAARLLESVRQSVNRCVHEKEGAMTAPEVAVYFSTLSLIRGGLQSNGGVPVVYQYSDIFRLLSMGFGPAPQYRPGHPVVDFFLTREDLAYLLEFLDLYRHVTPLATPGFSESLRYDVRSWGIPFVNRTTHRLIAGKPYEDWPALVHVASNATLAHHLVQISTLSRGLIDIRTRNSLGAPTPPTALRCEKNEPELLAEAWQREGPS